MTNKPYQDSVEQQIGLLLGLKQQTVGKTQARQAFLPLIGELDNLAKTVKITDREEPVAVLISYNHWSAIISKLAMFMKPASSKPKIELMGSVKMIGDLESASKRISKEFEKSIIKSGKVFRGEL